MNFDNFLKEVFFRFNTQYKKSHYFKVDLLDVSGKPLWSMHENEKIDLAVLPINAGAINEAKIEYYFFEGKDLFYAKDFKTNNIS